MNWRLFVFLLLVANAGAWYAIFTSQPTEGLALYFLDIGQGDAQLIDFGRAQILIDGGPDARVLDQLGKILPISDRYLDLVILTHPQLDHFGGLIDVLKLYQVGKFLDNSWQGTAKAYKNLPEADLILAEGDKIIYGDYQLKILNPPSNLDQVEDLNETSIVTLLEGPEIKILYTADIGFKTEEAIRKKYKISANVLKVPHHGSKNSSGGKFLREVAPAVAIIEVGRNSYGHPHPKTLERLETTGASIYTTLDNGLIKITVDEDKTLRVFTEK